MCQSPWMYACKYIVVGMGQVVVYGSSIDVYCCVQAMLQTGLSGQQIVIIKPPQPSEVTCLITYYQFDLLIVGDILDCNCSNVRAVHIHTAWITLTA